MDTWTSCGILAVVSALGCMIFELKKNATRITRCVFLGKTTEVKMKNNTSNPSQSYLKTKKEKTIQVLVGTYFGEVQFSLLLSHPPSIPASLTRSPISLSHSPSSDFAQNVSGGKNHGLGD